MILILSDYKLLTFIYYYTLNMDYFEDVFSSICNARFMLNSLLIRSVKYDEVSSYNSYSGYYIKLVGM